MNNKKFGALSSSSNPQELSETVSSVLKMVGYLLGTLATLKGVDASIVNEQVQELSGAIIKTVSAGMIIFQSGSLVFAGVRRLLATFFAKQAE